MRLIRVAVVVALVLSPDVEARRARPTVRFAPPPPVRNLLWIAAHPDDELLVAPALALFCRDLAVRCTIAVATRGESGTCELPSCGHDLAGIREQELRASAALFSADVRIGSLPDGSASRPEDVLAGWNAAAPGVDQQLDALLEEIRPDLVLTLDPRHGSTCHPDHRAIGRAVVAACERGSITVGVLRTRAEIVGAWDAVIMRPNLGAADLAIDGALRSSSFDGSRWEALVAVARSHPSQFTTRAIEALEAVPPEQRLLGLQFVSSVPALDECLP